MADEPLYDHLLDTIQQYGNEQYREGFNEGLKAGCEDFKRFFAALGNSSSLVDLIGELCPRAEHGDQQEEVKQVVAPPPPAGGNGVDPAPLARPQLSPYLATAYEYLRDHPGVTAHKATSECRNAKNGFYKLVELGWARKEGPRFYAVDDQDLRRVRSGLVAQIQARGTATEAAEESWQVRKDRLAQKLRQLRQARETV